MQYLVPVYVTYTIAAIVLTAALARTLYRNGAVFLTKTFDEEPELAAAVNRMLVTGFYMLNLGYSFFLMRADEAGNTTEAFQVLARKMGILLVSLAVIHFANMVVFNMVGGRRRLRHLPPPVAPQTWTRPFDPAAGPTPSTVAPIR